MSFKKSALLGAVSLAIPLVVACSGGAAPDAAAPESSSGGDAQQVTVQGFDEMRFEPESLTAQAGQPVELTFENEGQIVHDFTLEEGVSSRVHAVAEAGQTATATFTVADAGTYTFICSQPGHAAAGMQGTLTVE